MIFKENFSGEDFSRIEYLKHFKDITSATATRDLKLLVEKSILLKHGDKRLTKYKFS